MTDDKPDALADEDDSDHEFYDDTPVACTRCLGSGYFASCFDDLCHGSDSCIHGDDPTCSRCGGSGEEPLRCLDAALGGGARSTDGTGGETPVTTTGAETLGSHREQAAREGAHVQGEKRKPGSTPPDSAAKIAADLRAFCDYFAPRAGYGTYLMDMEKTLINVLNPIRDIAARVEALGLEPSERKVVCRVREP